MIKQIEQTKAAASALLKAWAATLSADELRAVERAMDNGAAISIVVAAVGLTDAPFQISALLEGAPGGPHLLFQHTPETAPRPIDDNETPPPRAA